MKAPIGETTGTHSGCRLETRPKSEEGSAATASRMMTSSGFESYSTDTFPIMSSESICQRCGRFNPVWTAPSPLWNFVMRGGSINGIERYCVVCPSCFVLLAEERGVLATGWRLTASNLEMLPLETVTPSGRVWNPVTWLWDDPNQRNDED